MHAQLQLRLTCPAEYGSAHVSDSWTVKLGLSKKVLSSHKQNAQCFNKQALDV